jgi:hypothetical protein
MHKKHIINLNALQKVKISNNKYLSWNINSTCIWYWYNYKKKPSNIFKHFEISFHTHHKHLQQYTLNIPLKLFTESTRTYYNIEGIKKNTKASITNQNQYFDYHQFIKFVENTKNKLIDIRINYSYFNYVGKNKDTKSILDATAIPSGLQYSNFSKKNTNHENLFAMFEILNNLYNNTSYVTNALTNNSSNLLHMHRKFIKEQYYNIYYL